jgi:hypothetical protein
MRSVLLTVWIESFGLVSVVGFESGCYRDTTSAREVANMSLITV